MSPSHLSKAIAAAAAIALAAAPPASAGKPDRIPLTNGDPFVLPGCAYPLELTPSGQETVTFYDDGRTVFHSNLNPTLTNLETGDAERYSLRYRAEEVFNEATGLVEGHVSGRFLFTLLPGDMGPAGVDADGAVLRLVGDLRYTLDPGAFVLTAFASTGTIDDVCADLA